MRTTSARAHDRRPAWGRRAVRAGLLLAARAAALLLLASATAGELGAQKVKFRRVKEGSPGQANPEVPGKISVNGVDHDVGCPKKAGTKKCVEELAADLNRNADFSRSFVASAGYDDNAAAPGKDQGSDYVAVERKTPLPGDAPLRVNWKPGKDNPYRSASASLAPLGPYQSLYEIFLAVGIPPAGTATFAASIESLSSGVVLASHSVDVLNGTDPAVVIGLLGAGLASAGAAIRTSGHRLWALLGADEELYVAAHAIADVGTEEVPLAHDQHYVAGVVPEPPSLSLLALGGAALVLAVRRRAR